jgi:hypothetical protein
MHLRAQLERSLSNIYRGEKHFQRKLQKQITLFVQYNFFLKSPMFEKTKRERICYNSCATRINFLTYISFALSRGVLKLRIRFMHSCLAIYSHI